MKYAVLAWFVFTVGLVVLGLADYCVRWRDGWLGSTGSPTPDVVWFGVPLILGVIAVVLLWHSTSGIQRLWARVVAIAVQAFLGFLLYMAACFWYVIETGVDSM